MALRSAIAVLALFSTSFCAAGHGYLIDPPARNLVDGSRNGNCPHCGNGRGVCGDGNQWPSGSNYVGTVQAPQRTFTAGSIVQLNVSMNVNHMGHHEFFICDRPISSDDSAAVACLQRWPLERVPPEEVYGDCVVNDPREDCQPLDPNFPGRWYHIPGRTRHSIRYRIPANLQCSHCTLQWFWPTANSAAYDQASYQCYNQLLLSRGWSFNFCGWMCSSGSAPANCNLSPGNPRSPDPAAGSGFEEFRNCADVAVVGRDGSAPTAPPTMSPTQAPSMAPTAAPTPTSPPSPPSPAPPSPSPSPLPSTCQACAGEHPDAPCIWSDGLCYPVGQETCEGRAGATWCGAKASEPEPEPEPEPVPEPEAAPVPAPPSSCHATPNLNRGVTDADCRRCLDGYQWWPCNEAVLCTGCSAGSALAQEAGQRLRGQTVPVKHHVQSQHTRAPALVQQGAELERTTQHEATQEL